MAKDVTLDHRAIEAFLKSKDVENACLRPAQRIASAAGGTPDYVATSFVGRTRASAEARTATAKARREEAKSHRLIASIDAGRG